MTTAPTDRARQLRCSAALLVAVLCALVLGAGSAVALGDAPGGTSTTASEGDAFYEPPDPLPKGRPGALIRSAPLDAPQGADAWRVLYHSRAVDGRDVAVSGVVVAPLGEAPKGGRPIIAVALGTSGLADQCATSRTPEMLLGSPVVQAMIDAGYVFAVTDYEGLGTPGLHPYGSGQSTGRNLLDVARAARKLPEAHAGKRVVLRGFSEGGHAALFAAELAPTYAPELDLLGVVSTAPLIDLVDVMNAIPTTPGSVGFGVMFVKGIEAAYPKAAADLVLTDQAVAESAIVDQQCVTEVLAAFAGQSADEVFARNPVDVRVWRKVLERNSLRPGRVDVPILLVKGDADELLPKAGTDEFVADLCAAGDPVEYRVYPGATHTSVLPASQAETDAWIADRVAGTAASSTC